MLYKVMFYGGISISILMLIISVILFFKLNIVKVIYDITGITAKRKIQEIKDQNIKYGQKKYIPMDINEKKGDITGKLSISEKLKWKSRTDKLINKAKKDQIVNIDNIENKDALTTMLAEDTSAFSSFNNETELLIEIKDIDGTDVLDNLEIKSDKFSIIFDVLSIHTNEVI